MVTTFKSNAIQDSLQVTESVKLVQRGKKRRWVAIFKRDGMTTSKSTRTANREVAIKRARILATELLTRVYGDEHGDVVDVPAAEAITIASAVEQFAAHKRLVDQRRPKTMMKYEGVLKAFGDWATSRGATTLNDLSVQLYRRYEGFHAKTHAPETTHIVMVIVKAWASWCGPRGHGLLENDPFASIKLPKPRARPKYTPLKADIDAIISNATGEAALQLLAIKMTGLRVDELANLRPSDVDLTGGWINICVRADWSPKTHQGRRIPIHPDLLDQLRTINRACRPWFFRGLPTSTGHVPDKVNDRRLLIYMQGIAKRLGIPVKRKNTGIVVHSLRHYFETAAVNSGVPQFVIDAWMGHSGGRTQGQTYYGLTDSMSQEWMQKVKF